MAQPAAINRTSGIVVSVGATATGGSSFGYGYNIYRGKSPTFTESASNEIASGITATIYTNDSALAGQVYC